ncbi:hypothetical protein RhiirA4_481493 [Rhizophagus irregularis]|uniref:Uncharacterized protein n=1 Tax=Rhizophagus irregularis TaxID=588596 RepID=A0A2I1HJK1_9GLOM|nr:hypothetical protein RhiirA4_481493 [Rhizophagus irregularis]
MISCKLNFTRKKQHEKFQAVIQIKCGASSFKIIQISKGRRKLVVYFKNWKTTLSQHFISNLKKVQSKLKTKNTSNKKKPVEEEPEVSEDPQRIRVKAVLCDEVSPSSAPLFIRELRSNGSIFEYYDVLKGTIILYTKRVIENLEGLKNIIGVVDPEVY